MSEAKKKKKKKAFLDKHGTYRLHWLIRKRHLMRTCSARGQSIQYPLDEVSVPTSYRCQSLSTVEAQRSAAIIKWLSSCNRHLTGSDTNINVFHTVISTPSYFTYCISTYPVTDGRRLFFIATVHATYIYQRWSSFSYTYLVSSPNTQ